MCIVTKNIINTHVYKIVTDRHRSHSWGVVKKKKKVTCLFLFSKKESNLEGQIALYFGIKENCQIPLPIWSYARTPVTTSEASIFYVVYFDFFFDLCLVH